MRYAPWLPPRDSDRLFYDRFRTVAGSFHDGTLSPDTFNKWQTEQLRAVLELTSARSPFYAQHFKGIDLASVTPDDLSTLPFTTKIDLREQMLDIVSGDIREATYFFQTTGTTGPSTPCPRGVREILASNYNAAMSIETLLTSNPAMPDMPIFGMLCTNELTAAGKTYTEICKDLGMLVIDSWPGSPLVGWKTCIELLQRLKVDVILTTPGQACGLAKAAVEYGFDPRSDFGIKTILCLGEVLSEPMKQNIRSLWGGADVFDFVYGSQESFIMAAAGADGNLIPHLPNYIWEVIDLKTGAPRRSGYGELCVTCLVDGIKPLIRYRTGDLVDLVIDPTRPVATASTLKLFGRTRDAIVIGDTRVTALELEKLTLDGVLGCIGYQCHFHSDDVNEEVRVLFEFLPGTSRHGEFDGAAISNRISKRLGVDCTVEVVDAVEAHTRSASWVSWKAARIIDHRTNSQGGREASEREADEREVCAAKATASSLPSV